MTGHRAFAVHLTFSRWAPLWAFLGIGLPISFAVQVRPALMFLNSVDLFPLYATEWVMLGALGLLLSGLIAIFDALAAKSQWLPSGSISRVGFAVIGAIVLFFGAIAWITAFKNLPPPSLRPWIGLLIAVVLAAGGIAVFGPWTERLVELARVGRFLSLAGAVTLLSLPFSTGAGRASAAPSPAVDSHGPPKPNIVLITIDALAASHLSPYGYKRDTSPQIELFSSQSTVFTQFHASSNFTTPGIASILTGVAPWTHRVLHQPGRVYGQPLRESLPARLQAAGYRTAYFASNPWAGGRTQGFGHYFDYKDADLDWVFGPCFDGAETLLPYLCAAASNRLISYSYSATKYAASWLGLITLNPHSDLNAMAARVARWGGLAHEQPAPLFLWIHLFPPHDPYAAPPPWLHLYDKSSSATNNINSIPVIHFAAMLEPPQRIATLEARYDESIAYVDHYVGQLLSTLRQELGQNTAFILTADHGESFDHGYGSHGGVMLYEDLIHVPLMVSLPGGNAARRDELASQVDIAPTIAAIAGIPSSSQWEGRSLLPGSPAEDPTVFSMNFEENASHRPLTTGAVAILRSNWKLVHFIGDLRYPHLPQLHDQLFDLRADPHEHVNLAATHPEIAAILSSEIEQQLARHGGAVAGG